MRTMETPLAASHSRTRAQPEGSRRSQPAIAAADTTTHDPWKAGLGDSADQASEIGAEVDLVEDRERRPVRLSRKLAPLLVGRCGCVHSGPWIRKRHATKARAIYPTVCWAVRGFRVESSETCSVSWTNRRSVCSLFQRCL